MDDSDDNTNVRQHTAAQACETCRARKTKCDEDRPQCRVCQRLNVPCNYREPKPTKKDKTLVHILNTLTSLESRFDRLELQWKGYQPPPPVHYPSIGSYMNRQGMVMGLETGDPPSVGPLGLPDNQDSRLAFGNWTFSPVSLDTPSSMPYRQRIEARKIVAWPAIRTLLQDDFLQIPTWDGENDGGEKWLTRISIECESSLPTDEFLDFRSVSSNPSQPWDSEPIRLTKGIVEDLCETFFRSFHAMYPILDRRHFYEDTLPEAYSSSFDQDDGCSTLVLLVLALGAVAREGVSGNPILEESTWRSTGIRGGSPQRPPGLAFWNEACRRLGRMMLQCDLNMLQSFILLSIYYSQCSRNKDYWHMTTISCALCSNIVRTLSIPCPYRRRTLIGISVDEWKSFEGDAIARSYWMCILLEGGLVTQLGLSSTGITELENSVPLPLFLTNSLPEKSNSDEDLFIEYHFLAHITLRALLNRIYTSLRFYTNPFQADGFHDFPPKALILELARQLIAWREYLPSVLNWNDENPDVGIETHSTSEIWQQTILEGRATSLNLDIKTILHASLRTRYKYALYLLWRPYLYKVLHFPDSSTNEDLQGCIEAFKACSMWPLSYPVVQDQRRMIPHIYEYSHTFFGILVLLHACPYSPTLNSLIDSLETRDDLELSKGFMLRWMRDMQVIHPVARWCWQLLKVIYRDHPQVKDLVS